MTVSLRNFLAHIYWNNSLADYVLSISLLVAGIIIINLLSEFIIRQLAKLFGGKIHELFHRHGVNFLPFFYFLVFYLSIQRLSFNRRIDDFIDDVCLVVFAFCLTRFLLNIIGASLKNILYKTGGMVGGKISILQGLWNIIKIIIWTIFFIFLLDNFGIKITPLIAGLGVGGAAIALATQAILKDLFSSFAIYFDRPFSVGDFIIVDDFMGTVEYIGVKTTRILSLSGEQLILANSDLVSSRLRNYQRMQKRRVEFHFKVLYDTPPEKLRLIPQMVEKIIGAITLAKFDRAHFAGFNDIGLDFDIVYFVLSSDFNKYMDVQQQINLGIKEEFLHQNIQFAYSLFLINRQV